MGTGQLCCSRALDRPLRPFPVLVLCRMIKFDVVSDLDVTQGQADQFAKPYCRTMTFSSGNFSSMMRFCGSNVNRITKYDWTIDLSLSVRTTRAIGAERGGR